MSIDFYRYADEGDRYLEHLANSLGYANDTARAGRVLRAVLHTLRCKLIAEESLQLIAQFPMFLKALYVDGWKLSAKTEKIRDCDDFLHAVIRQDRAAPKDFPSIEEADHATRTVLQSLRAYVSEGEMEDVKAAFPAEVGELLN